MAVKELDQGRVGLCGTPFERRVCAALWPLRMQGETRARAGEGDSRRLRARDLLSIHSQDYVAHFELAARTDPGEPRHERGPIRMFTAHAHAKLFERSALEQVHSHAIRRATAGTTAATATAEAAEAAADTAATRHVDSAPRRRGCGSRGRWQRRCSVCRRWSIRRWSGRRRIHRGELGGSIHVVAEAQALPQNSLMTL